jgi:hypothetical protein
MESTIQFERLGIATTINRYRLTVPLNQREYSWEIEHVRDLLTDIAGSMQKNRAAYFLGTIVLTRTEKGELEVADGQQRLATTTMAIAAIRDIFLEANDEVRAASVENDYLFKVDIQSRERISKLTLNADDNEFFCSKILCRPKERNQSVKAARESHVLLESAFAEIHTYFGNIKAQVGDSNFSDALIEWLGYLSAAATVIVMTVPDDIDAYVMFETLNDRGLKSSQADLVKNHLFKEAGDRRAEIQAGWSLMRGAIESLGEDDLIIDFLRHVCNLLYGQTRERDVFEKIKTENKGSGNAVRFVKMLGELADDYAAILNPEHPKWNQYPPDIRQSVRTLNLLSVSQIRPLLLGAARHLEPKHAARAFNRFVAWTVRFIICGGGRGGDMERNYCAIAHDVHTKKIKSAAGVDAAAIGIVPTDGQFQAAFETVRVNVSKLARYYLRSLEKTASNLPNAEQVANEDAKAVNLEHVLPSEKSPDWPKVTERDIEAHANRLGNLLLLQSDLNSQIDRKDFGTKKKAYKQSSFLLTSNVADAQDWGIQEIDSRQKQLAGFAVKTWKIG